MGRPAEFLAEQRACFPQCFVVDRRPPINPTIERCGPVLIEDSLCRMRRYFPFAFDHYLTGLQLVNFLLAPFEQHLFKYARGSKMPVAVAVFDHEAFVTPFKDETESDRDKTKVSTARYPDEVEFCDEGIVLNPSEPENKQKIDMRVLLASRSVRH